jgi:uncharacterized protein (DUF1330 family)
VVILAFPDEAEAQRFGASPEYAKIAKNRKAGADAIVLMVKSLNAIG